MKLKRIKNNFLSVDDSGESFANMSELVYTVSKLIDTVNMLIDKVDELELYKPKKYK